MRISFLVAAAVLATLPACFQLEMSAQAGYAQMAIDGRIGYVAGSGSGSFSQDVESAFGLGSDQGVPYGRAVLDTGVQVFSVSGFTFDESGTGVLEADFGDSGVLVAGTPVRTDLQMFNVKGAYAFEIELGPVSLSPGIAVDYFDLDLEVADLIGIATERLELSAPIPLPFLRGEVRLGIFSAVAELGYMQLDVEDVDTTFFDAEAMLMVRPTPLLDFFVGYRSLQIDATGEVDGDALDTDMQIGGFMVGGGIHF